jgi:hypothetical protein
VVDDEETGFVLVGKDSANGKLVLDGLHEDPVHLGVDRRRALDPSEALIAGEIDFTVPLNADGLGLGVGAKKRQHESDRGYGPHRARIIASPGTSRP